MVATFLKHRLFYEDPRYILFIYMVLNDAVQLTLLTALYVVSYAFQRIPASACCVLVLLAVLTTRNTPLILGGMAVERYTAICHPLRYRQICTLYRTLALAATILLLGAAPPLSDLLVTLAVEPPSFFRASLFCDHSLLFREPSIYYKNCAFDTLYFSFVFLTLFCTYFKIVRTARAAASTDWASARRARNTVLLHGGQLLLCMLNFVMPSMQAFLLMLFPGKILEIRYVNFLLVYIIPRFLSPMIYGFRDEKFRKYWSRLLMCRVQAVGPVHTNHQLSQ
ncbi:odorant receptor 131-2-like [Amia ocellicauda]|uniref:odorant receptor 131-2-like n=1 Tax=Amia ocellicauda TaxID=2972642 RepID=UPI0034638CE3